MNVIDSLYTYLSSFFFFNDTATTEIYTLSLHDALPIFDPASRRRPRPPRRAPTPNRRSEEHTSELQSRFDLVCRLLLEKKNNFLVLFQYSKNKKHKDKVITIRKAH